MVDPSQTQSSSPRPYYYDAKYEKQAAEQRPVDHVDSLFIFNDGQLLYQGGCDVKGIFASHASQRK
jgi:hypothetical protein